MRSNKRKVIASVQNALIILNLFNDAVTELGITDISNALSMDPGTVSGYVYTLKSNGYLDQNADNRKYRLGLKIVERALVLLNQMDLRKISAPYLEELRDWCGESVNLAIIDGNEIVYIERYYGSHDLGIRSELGKRNPIHSTALGKAIAAYLPEQDFENLFDDYNFFLVTNNTNTDLQGFMQDLDDVRQNKYAIDDQGNELGVRCIGVPIFNHEGYPIGAISISCPIQRLPKARIPEFGKKLIETAKKISGEYGYSNI